MCFANQNCDRAWFKNAKGVVSQMPSKFKIGCFVKENGCRENHQEWDSVLNDPLWAHYTENSQGVAIVFDKLRLVNSCKAISRYCWARDEGVKYVEKSILAHEGYLPYLTDLDKIEGKDKNAIIKHIFDKTVKLLSTKSENWSYENEFRIIIYSEDAQPVKVNFGNSIVAVVFGHNVSEEYKREKGQTLREKGITAYYIEFAQEINQIKLQPIESPPSSTCEFINMYK